MLRCFFALFAREKFLLALLTLWHKKSRVSGRRLLQEGVAPKRFGAQTQKRATPTF
jgi:hypothetical protein